MNDRLIAVASVQLFRPEVGGHEQSIETGDVVRCVRFETAKGPVLLDAVAELGSRRLLPGATEVITLLFDVDDAAAGVVQAGANFTLWPDVRQGVGYIFRVSRRAINTVSECEGERRVIQPSPRRPERRRPRRFGDFLRSGRT